MNYSGSLSTFPCELRRMVWQFALDELDAYVIYYYHKRRTRRCSAASPRASEILISLLLLSKQIKREVAEILEQLPCIMDFARDATQPLDGSDGDISKLIISRTVEVIDRSNGFIANPNYFNHLQGFPILRKLRLRPIWWEDFGIDDEAGFAEVLSGGRNEEIVNESFRILGDHFSGAREIARDRDLEMTVLVALRVVLSNPDVEGTYRGVLDTSIEIDLLTWNVKQLYVDMNDYSDFDYQSRKHPNIKIVPAEQVTWLDPLGFPALRHMPSGKVRSLAVTQEHWWDYDNFVKTDTYKQMRALNFCAYAETGYLRSILEE